MIHNLQCFVAIFTRLWPVVAAAHNSADKTKSHVDNAADEAKSKVHKGATDMFNKILNFKFRAHFDIEILIF